MDDELVAVTVVDCTADAFSAVYTFYQTGHVLAFGTLAILALIEQAQNRKHPVLCTWVTTSSTVKK